MEEAAQTDRRAPGERGADADRDPGAVAQLVVHLHGAPTADSSADAERSGR